MRSNVKPIMRTAEVREWKVSHWGRLQAVRSKWQHDGELYIPVGDRLSPEQMRNLAEILCDAAEWLQAEVKP